MISLKCHFPTYKMFHFSKNRLIWKFFMITLQVSIIIYILPFIPRGEKWIEYVWTKATVSLGIFGNRCAWADYL